MRDNEGRAQIPPELLEQFMKQQEEKITKQGQPTPAPAPSNYGGYQVPTDFIDLPSKGAFYSEAHPWHTKEKVEVRYMTTREEEILSSVTYAENGVMFDKLIESVTVDNIRATSLLPGDRNAILINTRKNSYGDDYQFNTICGKCYTSFDHTVKLSEMVNKEFDMSKLSANRTVFVELPVSKRKIEFKIATGEDVEFINKQAKQRAKHNLQGSETMDTHRRLIVSVDGDSNPANINALVPNLLLRDSKFLQKKYDEYKPDVNFVYSHECEACGHLDKGGVPVGINFFWFDE